MNHKSLDWATHFVRTSEASECCQKLNHNARMGEHYTVVEVAGWAVIAIYKMGVFAGYW